MCSRDTNVKNNVQSNSERIHEGQADILTCLIQWYLNIKMALGIWVTGENYYIHSWRATLKLKRRNMAIRERRYEQREMWSSDASLTIAISVTKRATIVRKNPYVLLFYSLWGQRVSWRLFFTATSGGYWSGSFEVVVVTSVKSLRGRGIPVAFGQSKNHFKRVIQHNFIFLCLTFHDMVFHTL